VTCQTDGVASTVYGQEDQSAQLKRNIMRVDIYRRPEYGRKFSFLAVPETRNIPDEATNTDWQLVAVAVEVPDDADLPGDYDIDHVNRQIAEKSYAVTAPH
jgi:hypothetical protein